MPDDALFEKYDRTDKIKPPSARLFGLLLAVPFGWMSCARYLRGGEVRWWAAAISAALALTAIVHPAALEPVAAAWTAVLAPVHGAMTIVVMGLLFFLVIAPVGWLHRRLVPDPLHLRFDPRAVSYWQERPATLPNTMEQQF